jgi:hypothetical protein
VRRKTSVACVIRVKDTSRIASSPLCPRSWNSSIDLQHRRTLTVLNRLDAEGDRIPFTGWLSTESGLWGRPTSGANHDQGKRKGSENSKLGDDLEFDTEESALEFIRNLSARINHQILTDWASLLKSASNYVAYKV